ncbi:MAG: CDP-diacylglycerol--glycerol-3-phosphate 3-phosphatidyltransferase [Parcubacteria group bacterium Licking1014_1]|nr:MAG: CDP-diacylglycerol--glycerol-3-phosphate 3-phosphatidyltransferase [Parcubacteria group bacterium Licking1014_1]
MKTFLGGLQSFLEKIDGLRDELLFLFIKPYWPRKILPNHITYARVAIGALLFVLLFFFGIQNKLLIISLFSVGALTDLFDGSIARGTNKVTEFGAMLDSTADRILIVPIAIYSLLESHKWLLLALILTEIINALTSMYYKSIKIYLESNIFGKTKMVLQSLVFVVILIVWPNAPSLLFIATLWVTIIFSFLSIFSRIAELKIKKIKQA